MKSSAVRALTFATILLGMVGCQSGPRWARWKHEKAPEDTSLVARSAAPELPSTKATPQAVTVPGLEPAAPPSAANLAAAGTKTASPGNAIPSTSSPTIANAPTATYPAGSSIADKLVATPAAPTATAGTVGATNIPPMAAAASPSQQVATVPPSGPYDPAAYHPSAALAKSPAAAPSPTSPDADRYGLGTTAMQSVGSPATGANVASSTNVDAATKSPAITPDGSLSGAPAANLNDRHGVASTPVPGNQVFGQSPVQAVPDRYAAVPPTTPAAPVTPVGSSSLPTAPLANSPTTPLSTPTAAQASGAVQLTAVPGQYRPGGTSSYKSGSSAAPIEVASRPAPPATTNAPAATGTTPAGSTSEPWSPPTPTPGTRVY